jgi:murein DD-endopeptidase MepM/ murein hydrolase activator NlpD
MVWLIAALAAGSVMIGPLGALAARGQPAPGPAAAPSDAQPLLGAFRPLNGNREEMQRRGLTETGLTPIYPPDARCPIVTSGFGVTTRSDGSPRARRFYFGFHGGADIPAPEGTPILAMADGTVIQKKVGANIGGLEIILQHAPDDTGLGAWTYTQYKHLQSMPDLKEGDRVMRGQAIAAAGRTGTIGGHYGEEGFSHLHLGAYFSTRSGYTAGLTFVPEDGQWLDPLALFKRAPLESAALRALPGDRKRVPIAYVAADGAVVPAAARIVWPFACARR